MLISALSTDVEQFLGSIRSVLGSLLDKYTGTEITDKLGKSIIATVFRQLVIFNYSHDFELDSCI